MPIFIQRLTNTHTNPMENRENSQKMFSFFSARKFPFPTTIVSDLFFRPHHHHSPLCLLACLLSLTSVPVVHSLCTTQSPPALRAGPTQSKCTSFAAGVASCAHSSSCNRPFASQKSHRRKSTHSIQLGQQTLPTPRVHPTVHSIAHSCLCAARQRYARCTMPNGRR